MGLILTKIYDSTKGFNSISTRVSSKIYNIIFYHNKMDNDMCDNDSINDAISYGDLSHISDNELIDNQIITDDILNKYNNDDYINSNITISIFNTIENDISNKSIQYINNDNNII